MGTAETLFCIYEDATTFWRAVNVLCLAHKGTVIAGMRSKKVSEAKGHGEEDLHCRGLAADIVFDTVEDERRGIDTARGMELHPHKCGGHVHVQAFRQSG